MIWNIRKSEKEYLSDTWRVMDIIDSLEDVSQCGVASKYIDQFEKKYPKADCIGQLRNTLCDVTFELYFEKYGRKNDKN